MGQTWWKTGKRWELKQRVQTALKEEEGKENRQPEKRSMKSKWEVDLHFLCFQDNVRQEQFNSNMHILQWHHLHFNSREKLREKKKNTQN